MSLNRLYKKKRSAQTRGSNSSFRILVFDREKKDKLRAPSVDLLFSSEIQLNSDILAHLSSDFDNFHKTLVFHFAIFT